MLEVIVISVVLVLAAVLLLGVRVFFVKGGQFPNIHIGGSKAMKERGIGCATSQDRAARRIVQRMNSSDIVKQIIENN